MPGGSHLAARTPLGWTLGYQDPRSENIFRIWNPNPNPNLNANVTMANTTSLMSIICPTPKSLDVTTKDTPPNFPILVTLAHLGRTDCQWREGGSREGELAPRPQSS